MKTGSCGSAPTQMMLPPSAVGRSPNLLTRDGMSFSFVSPMTARIPVGLSIEETITRYRGTPQSSRYSRDHEIVELGFETDALADIPLGKLRERIVYLFRKYKPYAVFTFDPFGLYENNQDHVRVAQAVDEAFWVSCFDKHYPEHFKEGLEPFSVCERWYFARQFPRVTHYEEIRHDRAERSWPCAPTGR